MPERPKIYRMEHLVTFGDTNVVGNVYFANYFLWQGECRERLLAEQYPQFVKDLQAGNGMITEFANMKYYVEATIFEVVVIAMSITEVSRTRFVFHFDFIRKSDEIKLCEGDQAVVWVNAAQRPSFMPDALYEAITKYFGIPGS